MNANDVARRVPFQVGNGRADIGCAYPRAAFDEECDGGLAHTSCCARR